MQKNVIIRADDLGFSEAVNLGIVKTVEAGTVRTAGLMVNMEAAEHGVNLLRGKTCCMGLHSNISVGFPISRPEEIPTLVNEQGEFHSSTRYRSGEDFAASEDLYKEITAQYKRYLELVGEKPSYFEAHAVSCKNLDKVLRQIAEEYDLLLQPAFSEMTVGNIPVRMCAMHCMEESYDAKAAVRKELSSIQDDGYYIYVCHPGYLDSYLWNHSSLRQPRMAEVDMLCDPDFPQWLEDNKIRIRTYDDLKV